MAIRHPQRTPGNPPDGVMMSEALILEAYWALRQRLPYDELGSGEILALLATDRGVPREQLPSEALVRTVLGKYELPRRAVGRPFAKQRAGDGTPLLTVVRSNPPRDRR